MMGLDGLNGSKVTSSDIGYFVFFVYFSFIVVSSHYQFFGLLPFPNTLSCIVKYLILDIII